MWAARMYLRGATHAFWFVGSCKSGPGVDVLAAMPCHIGKVAPAINRNSPEKISSRSRMRHLGRQRFAPQIRGPLFLSGQEQSVSQQFVYAGNLYSGHPIVNQGGQRSLVDGTNAGEQVHAVFFLDVFDRIGARKTAAQTHLQVFVRAQTRTAAAAER